MIILRDISLHVPQVRRKVTAFSPIRKILSNASVEIPTNRRIGLFGGSGQDIKAVLNLLGGVTVPTAGTISRLARVSFPVGHLGSFSHELTVRKNVAHIARLYDVSEKDMIKLVDRVAKLGPAFEESYADLNAGQINRIAQIVAYCIPFDVYILSSAIPRPTNNGSDNLYELFLERTRDAGMIVPTHDPNFIKEYCDMAVILHRGKLRLVSDIEHAASLLLKLRRRVPHQ
jgi:capsular polysaccharide transport system ATP-binding protein